MANKIHLIGLFALVALFCVGSWARVIETRAREILQKSFNYQGPLLIKDDRTGELVKNEEDDYIPTLDTSANQTVDEETCWKLIVEQSDVTFALQNKVLNELQRDMEDLQMDSELKEAVTKLSDRMKISMQGALDALKSKSAQDYFDLLFVTSESVVQFSSLVRDPKMDEEVFLVLIKAVSRLGRNNSALIQEFVDNCTIMERSQPRPRSMLP